MTYALSHPKVQKSAKKEPRTQVHPASPPSGEVCFEVVGSIEDSRLSDLSDPSKETLAVSTSPMQRLAIIFSSSGIRSVL